MGGAARADAGTLDHRGGPRHQRHRPRVDRRARPPRDGGTLHYLWLAAPLTLSGAAFGAFGSINQTLALQDVPIRNGGSAGAVKQTAERTSAAMGNAIVTGLFFAVAAAAGQTVAFVASFGLVAVFMSAALAIAASDLRSSRRA